MRFFEFVVVVISGWGESMLGIELTGYTDDLYPTVLGPRDHFYQQ